MKLRTRLFVFSSIFLVMLPLLAYYFIEKIEKSLLQGQEEAQAMTASAIATVVKGYTGLFDVDENALYVYPTKRNVIIDGYDGLDEDWYRLKQQFTSYANDVFSLLLIDNTRYLYVYLKVNDNNIVYRNPRYKYLDSSDHIRLEYLDNNNHHQRLILLAEGQGNLSVYEANKDWQTWKNGQHVNAVYGVWRETASGYDVEIRLPVSWVEPERRLSISIVDVFSENERYPDTVVSTKTLDSNILNPLLFRSKEISSAFKDLNKSTSQICVVDKLRRVRAVIGGQGISDSICQATDKVSGALVNNVLQGNEQLKRIDKNGETIIIAAHPVFNGVGTIGAVLVSNSSQQILARQRGTLIDVMLVSLALFFLVVISLLFFSSWLTFRINRLKNQASSLIDESGRFISHIDLPDSKRHDEIGELSRSFSSLLDKLNSYTRFLETVPRMLRHEILNPVNTISMSLQSLQKSNREQKDSELRDIATAGSAIEQLQLIVSSLTEAANIDEALSQDEAENFDIAALLNEYVGNSQRKHDCAQLRYQGVTEGVFVKGNDLRMVQLLDKIKDNALDFALPDTEILFQLDINQQHEVVIHIKNEGETIPQQQLDILFHGMISHRSVKTDTPHLGIGLYVAHQIAQFHQGQLQIVNWADNQRYKQGVEVILILPIVR